MIPARNSVLIVAVASAVTAVSCGHSPQSYVQTGNDYLKNGKYQDASINYRKAIQKDPRYGEAYFQLGKANLKLRNASEAYLNLTRAEDLLPGREDVKVELADLAMVLYLFDPQRPQKLYDLLTRISRDLLAKNPNSFDGLRYRGDLALNDKKLKDAEAAFEKANAVRPLDPNVVGPWVDALFQDNQAGRAEQLALALIEQHKDFTPIYDTLYSRYMSANRVADAEKLLNTEAANNPKDKAPVLQLAQHYSRLQKKAEVTSTLNKLLADPKAFPDAHADVGDFYSEQKDWDAAQAQYSEGLRAQPDKKALYEKKIFNVLMAQGQREQALQTLDQLLKDDPQDSGSRAMRARLWVESNDPGQVDKAITELQALVKELPKDEGLWFALGRAYMSKGDVNTARTQFAEAAARNSRYVPARVYLAALAQRADDYHTTLRYADEVLALDPRQPAGRLWHAVGLAGLGNYDQADQEFARLRRDFPDAVDVQLQLALLRIAQKKYKEAQAIYDQIRQTKPEDIRSLEGLVAVSAAEDQLGTTVALLQRQVLQSPSSIELHSLLASTAARANKLDLAIEQYQWLLANQPKNVNVLLALSESYRLKGDSGSALATALKALQLAPNDTRVLAQVAFLRTKGGDNTAALEEYRRQLAANPDDAIALNNRAYLLAEEGKNLEEALNLIGKVTRKYPDNAAFKDTLAWVYIKRNMNSSAIQVLKPLVQKYPTEASFHYHLGIAYLQNGESQKAKAEFSEALSQKPSPDIAEKIKQAMSKIG